MLQLVAKISPPSPWQIYAYLYVCMYMPRRVWVLPALVRQARAPGTKTYVPQAGSCGGVPCCVQVRRGTALNEHANFETFPNALLLLFRIATADEWTGIMDGVGVAPPLCDPAAGDCGSALGTFYIMSFTLLTGQIMLNLFTTIVIETFEEMDEVRCGSTWPPS